MSTKDLFLLQSENLDFLKNLLKLLLVLLVISMVTAQFMVNRGLNLQLPKVAKTEAIKDQENIDIAIYKNGLSEHRMAPL